MFDYWHFQAQRLPNSLLPHNSSGWLESPRTPSFDAGQELQIMQILLGNPNVSTVLTKKIKPLTGTFLHQASFDQCGYHCVFHGVPSDVSNKPFFIYSGLDVTSSVLTSEPILSRWEWKLILLSMGAVKRYMKKSRH